MRHLLDITDLSTQEIDDLIALAMNIIEQPEKYSGSLKGKKLATLFYEPSTRTRLSFTAAMLEFGGDVLGFSDAAASSVSKGETVADTIRVVENFADIIAMRHNKDGAPWVAAQYSQAPIINAGDGGHCHPTQTLADLLTIFREKGTFENLTVGFCGDLKYGRTVHSLAKALGRYKGVKFVFISPEELKIPDYLRSDIDKENYNCLETNSLEQSMPALDILYMTRIQKERFDDEEQYNRLKDSFILNAEKLKTAKKDMIILHPLPRVNEISADVDDDARACYFKQVLNGKFIRRALIYTLLKHKTQDARHKTQEAEKIVLGGKCQNPRCISSIENIKPLYKIAKNGGKRCYYCDN